MNAVAPLLLTALAAGTLLYLHGKSSAKEVAPGTAPSAAGGGKIQAGQILTLEVVTNNAPVYSASNPNLKTPFGVGTFLGTLPAGAVVSLIATDGQWVRVLRKERRFPRLRGGAPGKIITPALEGWVGIEAFRISTKAPA